MDDKVKELVEWVKNILEQRYGSEIYDEYNDEVAEELLSHPDLALIVRGKPKCWYCKEPVEVLVVHDCGYSVSESFKPVIPLAEALKEEVKC